MELEHNRSRPEGAVGHPVRKSLTEFMPFRGEDGTSVDVDTMVQPMLETVITQVTAGGPHGRLGGVYDPSA